MLVGKQGKNMLFGPLFFYTTKNVQKIFSRNSDLYRRQRASPVAQRVKNLPAVQETQVRSPGQEDPLEKGMATLSSTLLCRIPWTKEPGRLRPWGCKESDTTE